MDSWITWAWLQLGGSGCYVLSTGEKIAYYAALIMAVLAGVLVLYGVMMKIFMR
jgi:hypothetical protein